MCVRASTVAAEAGGLLLAVCERTDLLCLAEGDGIMDKSIPYQMTCRTQLTQLTH